MLCTELQYTHDDRLNYPECDVTAIDELLLKNERLAIGELANEGSQGYRHRVHRSNSVMSSADFDQILILERN